MRILHIIDSAMVGGGQEHLYLLLSGLDRSRYQILVTCSDDGPLIDRLRAQGIQVIPTAIRKTIDPWTLVRLARIIREHRIELVHTHGILAGTYGRIAARLARSPGVVHTLHGIHYLNYPNPVIRKLAPWLDRTLGRVTDTTICVSGSDLQKGRAQGLFHSTRAELIPNGIDFRPYLKERSRDRIRADLGIPAHHRLVGAVARLHVQKGLRYLLEAMAALPRLPMTLLIVGDGPLRSELTGLAFDLGIAQNVRFLGARLDVPDLLAVLDLFVLPSLWEGLPLTILEAAATGLPIIGTAVGGTKDVLRHGESALLVPPRDPRALALALRCLLEDEKLAERLGREARRTVLERYGVERMVDATAQVYDRLAAEKGLGRPWHPRIGIDVRKIDDLGIGTYLQNLLAGLARVDQDSEIVLFHDRKDIHRFLKEPSRFRLVAERSPKYSLRELLTLPIQMRRHRIDLFHSPHYVLPPLRPCRAVVTIHDLIHLIYPEFLPSHGAHLYARMMLRLAARTATVIFTVSESSKQDIVRMLRVPPEKVVVAPNSVHPRFRPVECPETRSRLVKKLGLPERFALYVGSFSPHKNLPRLLQAFARVRSDHPDLHLVLVGERSDRSRELELQGERLGLNGYLHLQGRVESQELPTLYSLAEIFVFPSLYEGFGLPPLEAMACGVPTVVAAASSLPEVVGDAAVLVNPEEVEAIALGMSGLLSNPERQQELKLRGRRRAREYIHQSTAARTLEVYRRVLGWEEPP